VPLGVNRPGDTRVRIDAIGARDLKPRDYAKQGIELKGLAPRVVGGGGTGAWVATAWRQRRGVVLVVTVPRIELSRAQNAAIGSIGSGLVFRCPSVSACGPWTYEVRLL